MKLLNIMTIIIVGIIAFGCSTENADNAQLANPASSHCIEKDGSLEIVDTDDGQIGICTLSDGTRCEEWAFYRGECPKTCDPCPEYVMPGPEFCPNGAISQGIPNDCGCAGPPICTKK